MEKKKLKISEAAFRVLNLLKILNEKPLSSEEISELLSDESSDEIASKEVVSRYINTLRNAGYRLSRPTLSNDYQYSLEKSPVSIKLDKQDIKTLVQLEKYISNLFQLKMKESFSIFMDKLFRYMKDEDILLVNRHRTNCNSPDDSRSQRLVNYSALIRNIEKYCNDGQRIKIIYRTDYGSDINLVFEPDSIRYDSMCAYICGFNIITGESQMLNIENIIEVSQQPVKIKFNKMISPVKFKLKGRLAKGYTAYEDEKILEKNSNGTEIIVVAYPSDKDMLFRRLLRYGENCEVVSSSFDREKMTDMVEQTLQNYN